MSRNVGDGLRRTQKSYHISDRPFESRATGRRVRARMIGSIIGARVSEDT